MANINCISGVGYSAANVDATLKALQVSFRPPEIIGAYRVATRSGTWLATTAANSIVYSFRNPSDCVCVVQSVKLGLNTIAAGATTGTVSFSLYFTRGFLAADVTGGTLSTAVGNNNKLDTSFDGNSLITIYTTTTAGITAGTGTDDAQAVSNVIHNTPNTIIGQPAIDFFNFGAYNSGMVLVSNEGFRIRNDNQGPTTYSANLVFTVEYLILEHNSKLF